MKLEELEEIEDSIIKYLRSREISFNQYTEILDNIKLDVLNKLLIEGNNNKKYVLKKGGYLEVFSADKIGYSLESAARSINQPLNESDIHIIVDDINNKFKNEQIIKTKDIREFIRNDLIHYDFMEISKRYEKNKF